MSVGSYDFGRVTPTALIPAYARGAHTDIPWAKEVLAFLQARKTEPVFTLPERQAMREYAPFFEARFKAVSRILEEHDMAQVLELAAGLSPRGMDFSLRGTTYVEADLPASTELKKEIVTAVLGRIPQTLHLCAASVIEEESLFKCCGPFESNPGANKAVAVTTEGLLRYLTFPEKRRLAAGVHRILCRFGGFWATTDIHLRHWAHYRRGVGHRQAEAERLGRDPDPNYFDDAGHARRFFEECGFDVESRPLLDGIRDRVTSFAHAPEHLVDELKERETFILRPR